LTVVFDAASTMRASRSSGVLLERGARQRGEHLL
jgi:hypothetical protein